MDNLFNKINTMKNLKGIETTKRTYELSSY